MTASSGIGPILLARGEQGRPSIDLREAPRTLHRPGFIARPQPAAIEERGSDALPVDGMERIIKGS